MRSLLCLLLLAATLAAPNPNFLSNTLGSSMVLPRAPKIAKLWGQTAPRVDVTMTYGSIQRTSKSDGEGYWEIALPPTSAGGPYTIKLASASGDGATLTDVMFGDVYFCSGQSNMDMAVGSVYNASTEIQEADKYPNIRLFTTENLVSDKPQRWLLGIRQPWSRASAKSVGGPAPWGYFSATCWFFGREVYNSLGGKIPVGLVTSSWGGTVVQAWSSPRALTKCKQPLLSVESLVDVMPVAEVVGSEAVEGPRIGPNDPTALWNAKVVPYLNWNFTAVVWYQGEANAAQSDYYRCAFPAMIRDWSAYFQAPNMSFYFVQLSTWRDGNGDNFNIPRIRLAQTAALNITGVAMATAFDLGDPKSPIGDIHPRSKKEVGRRLALLARAQIYKQNVYYLGPTITETKVTSSDKESTVAISFSPASLAGKQLILKKPVCEVEAKYCRVPAEVKVNGQWQTAAYRIGSGNRLELYVAGKVTITGARYGYADYPLAVVYNGVDLPLPPFDLTF